MAFALWSGEARLCHSLTKNCPWTPTSKQISQLRSECARVRNRVNPRSFQSNIKSFTFLLSVSWSLDNLWYVEGCKLHHFGHGIQFKKIRSLSQGKVKKCFARIRTFWIPSHSQSPAPKANRRPEAKRCLAFRGTKLHTLISELIRIQRCNPCYSWHWRRTGSGRSVWRWRGRNRWTCPGSRSASRSTPSSFTISRCRIHCQKPDK